MQGIVAMKFVFIHVVIATTLLATLLLLADLEMVYCCSASLFAYSEKSSVHDIMNTFYLHLLLV